MFKSRVDVELPCGIEECAKVRGTRINHNQGYVYSLRVENLSFFDRYYKRIGIFWKYKWTWYFPNIKWKSTLKELSEENNLKIKFEKDRFRRTDNMNMKTLITAINCKTIVSGFVPSETAVVENWSARKRRSFSVLPSILPKKTSYKFYVC